MFTCSTACRCGLHSTSARPPDGGERRWQAATHAALPCPTYVCNVGADESGHQLHHHHHEAQSKQDSRLWVCRARGGRQARHQRRQAVRGRARRRQRRLAAQPAPARPCTGHRGAPAHDADIEDDEAGSVDVPAVGVAVHPWRVEVITEAAWGGMKRESGRQAGREECPPAPCAARRAVRHAPPVAQDKVRAVGQQDDEGGVEVAQAWGRGGSGMQGGWSAVGTQRSHQRPASAHSPMTMRPPMMSHSITVRMEALLAACCTAGRSGRSRGLSGQGSKNGHRRPANHATHRAPGRH